MGRNEGKNGSFLAKDENPSILFCFHDVDIKKGKEGLKAMPKFLIVMGKLCGIGLS